MVRSRDGTTFAEFLFVFPPLMVIFLCTLQLFLIYLARVGVHHAATAGARSAAVVLPDDPAFYDGQPPYLFYTGQERCDIDSLGDSQAWMDVFRGKENCQDGARLRLVRSAVNMAMAPFTHGLARYGASISDSARSGTLLSDLERVTGAALYNRGATSLSFPRQPGDQRVLGNLDPFPRDGSVHVRVAHLVPCNVPVARFLVCESRASLGLLSPPHRSLGRRLRYSEFRRGVESPEALTAIVATSERFFLVSAEASLPLQGAAYSYASEATR